MGDVTINETVLHTFIDGLKEAASAQERAAASSDNIARAVELSTLASEKRQEIIMSSLVQVRRGTELAIKQIQENTDKSMDMREKWWRKSLVFVAVAILLGNLFGVPLGKVVAEVLRLK